MSSTGELVDRERGYREIVIDIAWKIKDEEGLRIWRGTLFLLERL